MDLESHTPLVGVTADMIPIGSSVFWREWGGDLRVGGLWNWGEVPVHSTTPPHNLVPAVTLPPEP